MNYSSQQPISSQYNAPNSHQQNKLLPKNGDNTNRMSEHSIQNQNDNNYSSLQQPFIQRAPPIQSESRIVGSQVDSCSNLQFRPSVSHYLNTTSGPGNVHGSQLPQFSQKSSGVTSKGGLMSFTGDSNGRDRMLVGESQASSNSGNCTFTTNGNGITTTSAFTAISPTRQIMNPPSPKEQSGPSWMHNTDFRKSQPLESLTRPLNNNRNSFPDLTEMRLKTYQQNQNYNNTPTCEQKKMQLAESMARMGEGVGIIPGRNTSRNANKAIPRHGFNMNYQKSNNDSNSKFPVVSNKPLESRFTVKTDDQSSPSTVSRAQNIIDEVKNEVGKANSLVSLKKNSIDYGGKSDDYWLTMGVPRFEDNVDNIHNIRAKKQEYREALELQIRANERRKLEEKRKDNEHPFGGEQTGYALSFDAPRLGRYPNLRTPRNNFSKFENSVIHKSGIGPYECENNPYAPKSQVPQNPSPARFSQQRPAPAIQHTPVPQQYNGFNYNPQPFVPKQFSGAFYPNGHGQSSPTMTFPVQIAPVPPPHPQSMFGYPVPTMPHNPWQPIYPYPQQTQQQLQQNAQHFQNQNTPFQYNQNQNQSPQTRPLRDPNASFRCNANMSNIGHVSQSCLDEEPEDHILSSQQSSHQFQQIHPTQNQNPSFQWNQSQPPTIKTYPPGNPVANPSSNSKKVDQSNHKFLVPPNQKLRFETPETVTGKQSVPSFPPTSNFVTQSQINASPVQDEIDVERLKDEDYEYKTKMRVWQTSDQLPDPDLKQAFWKAELKQQIEEKRQSKAIEEEKAREEEERLDRKVQEHLEAERRELQMGISTKEQKLQLKLQKRRDNQDIKPVGYPNENNWRKHTGGGDEINYIPAKPAQHEATQNSTIRKRSPPVPALQRINILDNYTPPDASNIYNYTLEQPGRRIVQSTSDASFLSYLRRALDSETEKQERRLRKKLLRHNIKI